MKHTTESFARRSSGTRSQILEAAGQVFAEKGFDRATGKEIAERANTNSAAINYHFGGIERLYVAVLTEAHKSVASIEEIAAIAQSPLDPEEKLRRLIAFGIAALAEARQSWAIRVLSREFLAPTPVRLAVEIGRASCRDRGVAWRGRGASTTAAVATRGAGWKPADCPGC